MSTGTRLCFSVQAAVVPSPGRAAPRACEPIVNELGDLVYCSMALLTPLCPSVSLFVCRSVSLSLCRIASMITIGVAASPITKQVTADMQLCAGGPYVPIGTGTMEMVKGVDPWRELYAFEVRLQLLSACCSTAGRCAGVY